MMTTRDASSGKLVSRCMAVAAKESGGIDLLFHTNTESHKTDEIASSVMVMQGGSVFDEIAERVLKYGASQFPPIECIATAPDT